MHLLCCTVRLGRFDIGRRSSISPSSWVLVPNGSSAAVVTVGPLRKKYIPVLHITSGPCFSRRVAVPVPTGATTVVAIILLYRQVKFDDPRISIDKQVNRLPIMVLYNIRSIYVKTCTSILRTFCGCVTPTPCISDLGCRPPKGCTLQVAQVLFPEFSSPRRTDGLKPLKDGTYCYVGPLLDRGLWDTRNISVRPGQASAACQTRRRLKYTSYSAVRRIVCMYDMYDVQKMWPDEKYKKHVLSCEQAVK